jgi:hypothetical protein
MTDPAFAWALVALGAFFCGGCLAVAATFHSDHDGEI